MTKILITGGNGFVGSRITGLIKNKYKTHVISRSNGFDLSKSSYSTFSKKKKFDILINAASHVGSVKYVKENAASVIDTNIRIYANTYKLALECGIKKIININAACIYPGDTNIQTEKYLWTGRAHESSEAFSSPKKFLAHLGAAYKSQHGIISNNLILPGVYGPGDSPDPMKTHAMNALIIKAILHKYKNQPIKVWGTGKPIREWIYVDDVAKIVMKSIKMTNLPEFINLGQQKGSSISQTVKDLSKILKFDFKNVHFLTNLPDGDYKKVMSSKLFVKHFKNFKFINQINGINKTIEYYKKILI